MGIKLFGLLLSLSIKNYALIDNLQVTFSNGFSIITGETGAGKSILLGGLSLVLGKRADLSSLKNKDEKCVIEAEFSIEKYGLEPFFKQADLDFEKNTFLRREILPSGKSRAFINDTPVTLDVLSELGEKLIDIHSQHQTLQLTNNTFQFQVLDAISGNSVLLDDYSITLNEYQHRKKELDSLIAFQKEANKEHDYNLFLLNELQQAKLYEGMQESLEATYEKLNNIEEIREKLGYALQLLSAEQIGALASLQELKTTFQKLSGFGKNFEELYNRFNSVLIEMDDAHSEIIQTEESLEADPALLEEASTKLQQIYNLQKKHNVLTVSELIAIQTELGKKVAVTENLDAEIAQKQSEVTEIEEKLDAVAEELHNQRIANIPNLIKELESSLAGLGMQNARFKIELKPAGSYRPNGKDELVFLFSANKGSHFEDLKKVASGGELSRIMLVIKALMAKHINLPTIMFDEIDTGVSGEISNKMGDIMLAMSSYMQVFSITHLPQIAAKGNTHYKVYKTDEGNQTQTHLKMLSEEERVTEIAEMLGGKQLTSSALAHAKQLLN